MIAERDIENAAEASPSADGAALATILLVSLALVVRLALLTNRYAVNVFCWDQWAFLDSLFQPRSLWQLFRWQNGPHRMGIGLPLMVAVEQATRWNAVALSYLNLVVTAMAAMLALILKKRLAPPLRWIDVTLLVLFLNSSQWAIFVVTPDVSHGPLPLLLVVLFATILTIDTVVPRLVLLLLVDLVATFTGFGVFLGWIAPLVVLFEWRRGAMKRSPTLLVLAGALVVVASFFYDYQFPWHGTVSTGSCLGDTRSRLHQQLMFFVLLFARAVGATRIVSLPTLLGAVVMGMVCWQLARRSLQLMRPARPDDLEPEVVWVLLAFTFAFAAVAATGRSCLGLHSGLNSAYVPYMVPGILGLYLSYVGDLGKRARLTRRLLVYGFVAAYVGMDLWPRSMDQRQMHYFQANKRRWVECFKAKRNVDLCTQRTGGFTIAGEPGGSPRLAAKLATMEQRRLGFFAHR